MKNFLIATTIFLFLCQTIMAAPERKNVVTQGQFAVKLLEKMGHQDNFNEEKAIEMLSSLSIYPGVGPEAKWEKDNPATTKFIAEIQASVQIMLKKIAQNLNIPPPPTLDLYVFELPPAPQRAYFPTETTQLSKTEPLPTGRGSYVAAPPPVVEPPPAAYEAAPPAMDKQPMDKQPANRFLGKASKINPDVMIDHNVIGAFATQRQVPVIVELKEPVDKIENSAALEQRIATIQQSVLDTLSPKDFKLKYRYETVFSFSGWITRDGLIKLQNNPNVLRITLDELAAPH